MRDFYIYIHRRASDNSIFYIWKGKGRRAFTDCGRSKFWRNTVHSHGIIVEIVSRDLEESDAFRLEVDLIAGFREMGARLVNLTQGGDGVYRLS